MTATSTIQEHAPRPQWATTLGELCDQFGGGIQTGPFGSQLHASDYAEEGTPVVMPQDLHDGEIVCDRIARVPAQVVAKLPRHALRFGDVVFSRRGDVTRFAVVTHEQAGWLCGTGCIRIRLNCPEVNIPFFRRYLQQGAVGGWLKHHAKGVTMPNLNTDIVRGLPFVYPVETKGRPSSWFRTFLYDSTEQLKFTSIAAILYLGVFFKSIEEFETAEIQPIRESSSSEPLKAKEPDEQAEPETKPSWTKRISVLLRTHSLARTAERCKVPLRILAGEAAKQGIVVPLNARYAEKLGARRLGKLIDSIRSGEPFEILMRRYHVSYPGIYEIALSQPGLLAARDEKGVLGKAKHLKQHQEAILKYKLRHPNASRADIFRDLSASYTYVRNHSLAWFEAEFPEKAPVRPAKSAGRNPDWPRCDAALAKRIESVADDLKSKKERPERASKERLLMLSDGRKQYYGSLNSNRFPKTKAMLDANTESVPEFRVRLIRWAVRELVAAGEIVTITKLILKTGMHSSDLRRYVGAILQVVKERGGKANITATWSIAA